MTRPDRSVRCGFSAELKSGLWLFGPKPDQIDFVKSTLNICRLKNAGMPNGHAWLTDLSIHDISVNHVLTQKDASLSKKPANKVFVTKSGLHEFGSDCTCYKSIRCCGVVSGIVAKRFLGEIPDVAAANTFRLKGKALQNSRILQSPFNWTKIMQPWRKVAPTRSMIQVHRKSCHSALFCTKNWKSAKPSESCAQVS